MTVTLSQHAKELIDDALARGLGASPEEIVEQALEATRPRGRFQNPTPEELERRHRAVEGMMEFRKKHGIRLKPGEDPVAMIREWIEDGRKY